MLVTISSRSIGIWNEYQSLVGRDLSARFCESFYFADTKQSADQLAELVLSGTKRATAALVWSLEAENKSPPKPGDLSVMTNWDGDPLCIIETKTVQATAFEDVTQEFAAIEGEGDGSLCCWKEAHWAYFCRECVRIKRTPSLRMIVNCEQFEVVYRHPGKNAA